MPFLGIVDRLTANQHLWVHIAFQALERLFTPFDESVQYQSATISKPNNIIEGSITLLLFDHTN